MRLATINTTSGEKAAVVLKEVGVVPIEVINEIEGTHYSEDLFEMIQLGQIKTLNAWYTSGGMTMLEKLSEGIVSMSEVVFGPLFRHPSKIFGIGLNYAEHASDLNERTPFSEPASFFKPDTTIIGHGDEIMIPMQSQKTTAEAELGIVFGDTCKDVEEKDWLDVVAGFTTIIDMTAEDILRRNPRYLTRSKSFNTFFSFGPQLVTPDEIEDVLNLKVQTVINGDIYGENTVDHMAFRPDYLVSFHSKVMTMNPGDIISTGTPRATPIAHGDVVECRIDGFERLVNPVIDLKGECG